MMAIITVLWALVGYSLSFGGGEVSSATCTTCSCAASVRSPMRDYAATIPQQTFMIYQLMFAIITPALITGAFAERMKFSSMALFMVLWSVLVYDPMAHMVWGKGGLLNAALGGAFPDARFRRRHRRPHHLRSFGIGLCAVLGPSGRLSQRAHAAA